MRKAWWRPAAEARASARASTRWTLAALTSAGGLVACVGTSVSIGGVPIEEGEGGGGSELGAFGAGGGVSGNPGHTPFDGGTSPDASNGPPHSGSGGSGARADGGGSSGESPSGEGGEGTGEGGKSTAGRGGDNSGRGGMAGRGAAGSGAAGAAGNGAGGSAVESMPLAPPHVAPCALAEPCHATFEWRELTAGVRALSGDGRVLVGTGVSSLTGHAFRLRWPGDVLELIANSANFEPNATDFAAGVIVGYDFGASPWVAVQQVNDRPIERVPGSQDGWFGTTVSSDGRVILVSDWGSETGGQIIRNGAVTSVTGIELTALDADGAIVGGDRGQPGRYRSVLLQDGEVSAELGRSGEQSPVRITALSADGSVAVGITEDWSAVVEETASAAHAFRWSNGVTELLPEPSGWLESQALGCDATGKVVVGLFTFSGYQWPEAFVYSDAEGMVDLPSLLERRGLELPDGFYPVTIYVSADGKVLAGEAMAVTASDPYPLYSFPWRATLGD